MKIVTGKEAEELKAQALAQGGNVKQPIEPVTHGFEHDAAEFVLSFGTPDEIITEKVTISGREFDIKKFSAKESVQVGAEKWRGKDGEIISDAMEAIDNHAVVVIWLGVVVLVEGDNKKFSRPFFTREQVEAMYFGLPNARRAIDEFWDAVVKVNPHLAPKNA